MESVLGSRWTSTLEDSRNSEMTDGWLVPVPPGHHCLDSVIFTLHYVFLLSQFWTWFGPCF